MIDSVKNISNNTFHVSSEQNEYLSQEIKNEVYFGAMIVIAVTAVVVLFTKKGLHANTSLLLSKKRLKFFNDITHLYRFHPFTILDDGLFNIPNEMNEEVDHMTSDYISPNNNLEISNPTYSFDEPQNQEVGSALLPQ